MSLWERVFAPALSNWRQFGVIAGARGGPGFGAGSGAGSGAWSGTGPRAGPRAVLGTGSGTGRYPRPPASARGRAAASQPGR